MRISTGNGREALDYIKSDPEVVALITSAEPLSMSGLELCWETRLIATSHRPIYIIMMSSSGEHDKLIAALDHGADDFLGKPPAPEELYARLRAAERLAGMQKELIRLASTDSLTGMFNRRAFFEKSRDLCALVRSDGEPLSAVMVDIDHFKRVNDVYGHDVGDEAICAVAHELMMARVLVRDGYRRRRIPALLLDGRCLQDAVAIAERLRVSLGKLPIKAGPETITLTCSLGVSEWQRNDSIDRMLKRADMALYRRPSSPDGNRVVAASTARCWHRLIRRYRSGDPRRAQERLIAHRLRLPIDRLRILRVRFASASWRRATNFGVQRACVDATHRAPSFHRACRLGWSHADRMEPDGRTSSRDPVARWRKAEMSITADVVDRCVLPREV